MAAMSMAVMREKLSMAEYCLTADSTPMGMPMTAAMAMPLKAMRKLVPIRERMSLITGWDVRYEVPRSWWTTAL